MNARPIDQCTGWAVGVILLFGIVLRILYWPDLSSSATFLAPPPDAAFHEHWARGLAFGEWRPFEHGSADPEIRAHPYFRPPGYPFLLAAVYRIFGGGPTAPALLNMLLTLAGSLLLMKMATRIVGRNAALIAGLLSVSYWGLLYYEGMLLEPPLLFFLMAFSLWLCMGWLDDIHWGRTLLAGVVAGVGVLVRPNLLLCVPVCAAWGLWLVWHRRQGWPAVARLAVAYGGAVMITLSPAIWRNYHVSGEWPVLTTNGGINLLIGNHAESDFVNPRLPQQLREAAGMSGREWSPFDYPTLVRALGNQVGRDITAVEADAIFRQQAWEFIRAHPMLSLQNTLTKARLFWGPHEISNNAIVELDRRNSRVLRFGLSFSLVLSLALLGLVAWVCQWHRSRQPGKSLHSDAGAAMLLLIAYMGIYSASYLPFFMAARFRLAIVPFLMIFAAFGMVRWWKWIQARDVGMAIGGAALLLIVYGFASRPVMDDYDPGEYLWYAQQAMAAQRRGDLPEALRLFEEAARRYPDSVITQVNLGRALIELGRWIEARDILRQAVQLWPDNGVAQFNLGSAHLRLQEYEAAIHHYRAALAISPNQAWWWNELGVALALQNDMAEAGDAFRRAYELDPDHPGIQSNWHRWQQQQHQQWEVP